MEAAYETFESGWNWLRPIVPTLQAALLSVHTSLITSLLRLVRW